MWRSLVSEDARGLFARRGSTALFFALLAWGCSASNNNVPPETLDPGDSGTPYHPPIDAGHDASSYDATVVTPTPEAGLDASDAGFDAGFDSGCPGDGGANVVMCSGLCVNTQTDPKNCGGCGQTCDSTDAGSWRNASCIKGVCGCAVGLTNCGNDCVDLNTDGANCGYCAHNCQGNGAGEPAACAAGLCQPVLIAYADPTNPSSGEIINDLAVDATNVYWTWTSLLDPTGMAHGGMRSKAFGTGNSTSVRGSFLEPGNPKGIWATNSAVYWADPWTGGVYAYNSVVQVVEPDYVSAVNPDAGLAQFQPYAVVTDDTNIYWVDHDDTPGGTHIGAVYQTRLDRTGPIITLASGQLEPRAIAVDASYVYWANYGTSATGSTSGSINRVPIGGGSVTPIALGEDEPVSLALDSTSIYWTSGSNSGAVSKAPLGGGVVARLATNVGSPYGIVVDSQFVYWTGYNDGTLRKAPLAGGSSYTIVSGMNLPAALTSDPQPSAGSGDPKNIYWVNQGDGTIYKVTK
jgi:hypothetical protein